MESDSRVLACLVPFKGTLSWASRAVPAIEVEPISLVLVCDLVCGLSPPLFLLSRFGAREEPNMIWDA